MKQSHDDIKGSEAGWAAAVEYLIKRKCNSNNSAADI